MPQNNSPESGWLGLWCLSTYREAQHICSLQEDHEGRHECLGDCGIAWSTEEQDPDLD